MLECKNNYSIRICWRVFHHFRLRWLSGFLLLLVAEKVRGGWRTDLAWHRLARRRSRVMIRDKSLLAGRLKGVASFTLEIVWRERCRHPGFETPVQRSAR